jgi:hypothetical protein
MNPEHNALTSNFYEILKIMCIIRSDENIYLKKNIITECELDLPGFG